MEGKIIEVTAEELELLKQHRQTSEEQIQKKEEKIKQESRLTAFADLFYTLDEGDTTEIGTARMFGKLYKRELRYNVTAKEFYRFNGKYWERDAGNVRANELAKEFYKVAIISTARNTELSEKQREAYLNSYGKYSKKKNRDTLLKDCITELAVSESDFDKKVNLFNVRNGTIDLNTMKFRSEHYSDDLLTNYTDVEYIEGRKSELWERFISDILPNDTELQRYVQKSLGYAMTGNPELERLFILYGKSTRNGKSTLLNSVSNVLGSYAKNTPPETLQLRVRDSRSPSEDIARLSTARFVVTPEPSSTMVFDVALVKSLTGRDTITARRLNESSFEYIPKFSIFMNTNYLPKVFDGSLFSSNRVDVIPFNRHFKEEEQDTTLKAKLSTDESKTAILSWLLEGLKAYKLEGLKPPLAVKIATSTYRNQSDKLQNFIDESLEVTQIPSLTFKRAYELYCEWCDSYGYTPDKKSRFRELLEAKQLMLASATIDGKTVRNVISGYAEPIKAELL